MDEGQPDDTDRRHGFSLSEEARRFEAQAGAGDFLEEIRRIARGDDEPFEPFTLKMGLPAGIEEAYWRAEEAEERAARADELTTASAQREARMEEMAIAAAARERAAEERDARRERREKADHWATIASAVFALVAAVGTVVGIVIAIVIAR